MANRKIKVNFFRLETIAIGEENVQTANTRLRDQIRLLDQIPFQAMGRVDGAISLDSLLDGGQFWYGSISKVQTRDLPPIGDPNTHRAYPIPLQNSNQGLQYSTCFVIDKHTNTLAIESIKNGVSIGTFCEFFSSHLNIEMEPAVIPVRTAMNTFNNMTHIRKFRVRVARVENLRAAGNRGQGQRAIENIIDNVEQTNSRVLDYTLSVGRERFVSLDLRVIKEMARGFLGIAESADVCS